MADLDVLREQTTCQTCHTEGPGGSQVDDTEIEEDEIPDAKFSEIVATDGVRPGTIDLGDATMDFPESFPGSGAAHVDPSFDWGDEINGLNMPQDSLTQGYDPTCPPRRRHSFATPSRDTLEGAFEGDRAEGVFL